VLTNLISNVFRIVVAMAVVQAFAFNLPWRSEGYAPPELRRRGDEGRSAASTPRFVSNSHFRVVYPPSLDAEEAEHLLNFFESTRTDLLRRVSAAGVQPRLPHLEIIINETTGDFVGRTGMPPWAVAATKNNTIELQPLRLLKQRRILETTLRHELVHVLIDAVGGGQTPRWFAEGLAVYIAGEGRLFRKQVSLISADEIDHAFASARSADDLRRAYAAAYKLVAELIRSEGEDKVWKRIANQSYS
jgi:hypothetical protein